MPFLKRRWPGIRKPAPISTAISNSRHKAHTLNTVCRCQHFKTLLSLMQQWPQMQTEEEGEEEIYYAKYKIHVRVSMTGDSWSENR